jgi:hypothetical protein
MNKNTQLITDFYTAFAARDHAPMVAAYAPDATFADAVFSLRGKEIGAMWHMLCESGKDLKVVFSGVEADEHTGRAHWEAWYSFGGRPVHNILDARFKFGNGLIIEHRDEMNFRRWAGQALGPMGKLFGWAPFVQRQVQARARARLDRFIAAHPQYH